MWKRSRTEVSYLAVMAVAVARIGAAVGVDGLSRAGPQPFRNRVGGKVGPHWHGKISAVCTCRPRHHPRDFLSQAQTASRCIHLLAFAGLPLLCHPPPRRDWPLATTSTANGPHLRRSISSITHRTAIPRFREAHSHPSVHRRLPQEARRDHFPTIQLGCPAYGPPRRPSHTSLILSSTRRTHLPHCTWQAHICRQGATCLARRTYSILPSDEPLPILMSPTSG